jgi:hypothetical protein
MRNPLLIVGCAALLGACASQQTKDPGSRYFDPPDGSRVVVRQPIEIAPGFAHAVIQGGRSLAPSALRRYEPYCELEVNDVLDRAQQVRPGDFAITRVVRQQQQVGMLPANRYSASPDQAQALLLAGVGVGIGVGTGGRFGWNLGIGFPIGSRDGDDGPLAFKLVTMRLQSAAQPNVRELRCSGGWASAPDTVYPTLAEMNGALGELAEIRLPQGTLK